MNDTPSDPARPDLLTAVEVAALLRVHPNTVRNLTAREGLPHPRVGRLLRYRREAVEAWLALRERRLSLRSVTLTGCSATTNDAQRDIDQLDRVGVDALPEAPHNGVTPLKGAARWQGS